MKKLIITTILASLIVIPTIAHQSNAEKIDSLVAILPQLHGEAKLDALLTLSHLNINMTNEKDYVKMYLEEARRQKNIEAEGLALSTLTSIYYMQFDSDSVFIFGEEAISFNRKHKIYDDLFTAFYNIIRRYQKQGQMLTALRQAENAYDEAKELQDNISMAHMLSVMGNIFYDMEQYEEAVRHWTESIQLFEYDVPQHLPIIFGTYNFLAYMGRYMNQHQETLRYADSMQITIDRIYKSNPDYNIETHRFRTEYHRAIAYAELRQPEPALEAILLAEKIYQPQWKEVISFSAVQIDAMYGAYYFAAGDYNSALSHYDRLLKYYETERIETGIYFTKKYIARNYAAMGDYKNANEIANQILQRKEELNKERFYAQINELRTIYELDKAELEAERNKAKIHQQRLVNTGLIGACVAVIIIATLIVRHQRKIARKNIALYKQIKEQDRLNEKLQIAVSQPKDNNNLNENSEKYHLQELVSKMRELLIRDNFFANPKIEAHDIAIKLSTNRTQLYEALKTVTGKGLQEYIKDMKINEAKRILETADEPIKNIVDICGFNTLRTFYRQFTECYNISPAEYRKINRRVVGD